jgi:TonB family protein
MRLLLFAVLILVSFTGAISQNSEEPKFYIVVDDMPSFPGGEDSMYQYIAAKMKYPEADWSSGTQGKAYIQFIIDTLGRVSETEIIRGVSESIDAEALRVVQGMPAWKPGFHRGSAVPVQFTIPISFKISEEQLHLIKVRKALEESKQEEESVLRVAQVMPEFPGGEMAMYRFLGKNIKYPMEDKEKGVSGKVYVQFIVDKNGKVIEPKVIGGVSPTIDAEALRVVSIMPDFKPGTQDGEPVTILYTIPIHFQLQ